MAKIEATHRQHNDEAESKATLSISYITKEVKQVLQNLPEFSDVVQWGKRINGVLNEFTLINIIVYLVYERDKSFDMQSLLAFKSLKAYKYFYDGYVRNVWMHQCSCDNQLSLKMLYFRALSTTRTLVMLLLRYLLSYMLRMEMSIQQSVHEFQGKTW